MNPTKLRMANKLNIIKLIAENPGITLSKLQKYTKHKNTDSLKKELGELLMVGSYPYSPLDYIEIDFNENERLEIKLPVNLDKTIGLSVIEWLSIRQIIEQEIINPLNSKDEIKNLESIREKIRKIIPYSIAEENETTRKLIEESIREKKIFCFEYEGWKSKKLEERKVAPWFLFRNGNKEYLAAYCYTNNSIRNFRLESMVEPRVKSETFNISFDGYETNQHLLKFKEFISKSTENSDYAEIEFSKKIFYNLSRFIHLEDIQEEKDYFTARTKIIEKNWFLATIRGFGEHIIIKEPADLACEMKEILENTMIPELL